VTRALALAAVLALGLAPAADAAHEWRGAWGAPYTLELAEAAVAGAPESLRVELAVARPFGLRALSCQHAIARVGSGATEIHAGLLRGEGYREWHAGLARVLAPASPAGLLLGARVFGVGVAGETRPARIALTALVRLAPGRGLGFEAGLVDAGLARGSDAPVALLVARLRVVLGRTRAYLERSIAAGGAAETTLALGFPLGRLRLMQAIRLATGETGIAVAWPAGPAGVSVAERWHPSLGWTPAVAVRWPRGN
jgi:hypothetical protein